MSSLVNTPPTYLVFVDEVLVEGRAAVHAAVALVSSREELCHLTHSADFGRPDPAARRGGAGLCPLGSLIPPLLCRQNQATDRVGGTGQQSAAFEVHVSSPKVYQRSQRIDVPLRCRDCTRTRRGGPISAGVIGHRARRGPSPGKR